MLTDNTAVIERSVAFLRSMAPLGNAEHIGCQIFARTPLTEEVFVLADRVAKGDATSAPITLTLAAGHEPAFDVRGTHAYGTVATPAQSWGQVALVLLACVLAIAAVLVLRRGAR